jgi:hypothetical protein
VPSSADPQRNVALTDVEGNALCDYIQSGTSTDRGAPTCSSSVRRAAGRIEMVLASRTSRERPLEITLANLKGCDVVIATVRRR